MSDPTPTAPVTAPVTAEATPPVPPVVPPTDSRPQYEFSESQNQIINELAFAMMWVRVPLLVAGVFQAIIATGLAFRVPRDGAHIVGVIGHTLSAVICFMLAGWLLRAAGEFVAVTTTTGRDITHMMRALKSLGAWFDLLAFFVKLYLALLGILIVILLFGLMFGAFRESV